MSAVLFFANDPILSKYAKPPLDKVLLIVYDEIKLRARQLKTAGPMPPMMGSMWFSIPNGVVIVGYSIEHLDHFIAASNNQESLNLDKLTKASDLSEFISECFRYLDVLTL
jgi:hypothetical protein